MGKLMGEVSSSSSSCHASLPSLLRVPLIIKMYVICGRACEEQGRGKRKPQSRLARMYCILGMCVSISIPLNPVFAYKTRSRSALDIELQLTTVQWALRPALANDHSIESIPMPTGVSEPTLERAWRCADSIISYVTRARPRLLQKVHMGSLQPR